MTIPPCLAGVLLRALDEGVRLAIPMVAGLYRARAWLVEQSK